jgi:hypothetical protein
VKRPWDQASYQEHLDLLIALVTYLGLSQWRSRSPNGLGRDLGWEETRISETRNRFPGLFRRSSELHETAAGPQPSYTSRPICS